MNLSRRMLLHAGLGAGAALALAPNGFAEPMADWRQGYATPPARGFDPAAMKLVRGRAPRGLSGALYRNGPAQLQYGSAYASHWFDGDGLVHRIALEDGKAIHTGRFIQTNKRIAEQKAQKFLAPGFGTVGAPDFPVQSSDDVNAANTSVVMSGGEMLALWEAGSAFRLDPVTLETRGPKVWRDDLKAMPFLAHPKREPDGRLWNLAVSGPNVGIYRISPAGALESFGLVNIGAASYIHDWTMTATRLIILVQPWIQTRSTPPFIDGFEWRPQEGMKILIVDKDDLSKKRWAQAPARAFYHTGAAWEEKGGVIRLDGSFYPSPVLGSGGGADEIKGKMPAAPRVDPRLTQITIPLTGDAVLTETEYLGEFPQVDPRRHGLQRRLTAMVSGDSPNRPGQTALTVYHWESGKADVHDFGPGHMIEEHLFVPKPGGASEKDSWLIGTTINIARQASEVHVFDASDVNGGPVATWRAGYSWPLGFHGTWAS